jgi:hypothetical protein
VVEIVDHLAELEQVVIADVDRCSLAICCALAVVCATRPASVAVAEHFAARTADKLDIEGMSDAHKLLLFVGAPDHQDFIQAAEFEMGAGHECDVDVPGRRRLPSLVKLYRLNDIECQ